jgi:hypothetical protein
MWRADLQTSAPYRGGLLSPHSRSAGSVKVETIAVQIFEPLLLVGIAGRGNQARQFFAGVVRSLS